MLRLLRFRLSLRGFLICLTLGCLLFGYWINRVREQRNAVERARRAGAIVFYPHEYVSECWEMKLTRSPRPKWLTSLLGEDCFSAPIAVAFLDDASGEFAVVAGLPSVEHVALRNNQIRDLRPLSQLTRLRGFYLYGNSPANDISPLSNLRELEEVDISFSQVVDVSPLEKLPKLKSAKMINTPVMDLSPLANAGRLKCLNVSGTRVRDVSALAGLTELETLILDDTNVEDVSSLTGLPNLRSIHLDGTRIEDFQVLADFRCIERLSLRNTKIHDLSPLCGLTSLRELDVGATRVSRSSHRALCEALPGCRVSRR